MKKRLAILLCLAMLMTMFAVPAIATDTAPSLVIDNQTVTFDVPPIIDNGRTLVPLRAIFEKIGATVTWDDATNTASAVKGDIKVVVTIGSASPTINGVVKAIEVPAKIVNGRTLAPMRFVCEAFGGTVTWDANTRTASVVSGGGTVTPTPISPIKNTNTEQKLKATQYNTLGEGYAPVVKLNGKTYFFEYAPYVITDNNNNLYVRFDEEPLTTLLSIAYNDYTIQESNNNPFIDGCLLSKSPMHYDSKTNLWESKYIIPTVTYLTATTSYKDYSIYNAQKSKVFIISEKHNETNGVIYKGYNTDGPPSIKEIYVSLNLLCSTLGDLKIKIELDDTNKFVVFSFN
ncbi:MAG: copper amine oxidase N-terminal domain-containing protein [Syntrophomonas sp.]